MNPDLTPYGTSQINQIKQKIQQIYNLVQLIIDLTNSDIFSVSSDTDDGKDEQNVVDEDLKDAVLSSFQTEGKNVEVVFSFDTTGSMNSYLVQVSIQSFKKHTLSPRKIYLCF